MKPENYDGIYFSPVNDRDEKKVLYEFFSFSGKSSGGKKIGSSELGDMYITLFLKFDESGKLVYDDHFEAIFIDPYTYLRHIRPVDSYGYIVRKTDKSVVWHDNNINLMFRNENG